MDAKTAVVFVSNDLPGEAKECAENFFGRAIWESKDGLTRDDCLAICDGIVLRFGSISRTDIEKAPKLKYICRTGTGCDMIDLAAASEAAIVVMNNRGLNSRSVAELTLALVLSLARRLKELDSGISMPGSRGSQSPGLLGKTVGLVGMGDTAYQFARLLRPFDVKLIVWSPSSVFDKWSGRYERWPEKIEVTRADSLQAMLPIVDVLSLHCPCNEETRGLIGSSELAKMKKTAVVVNTARGGLIDEHALAECLQRGGISGAGLDVFETEPTTAQSVRHLSGLHNVICTPHVGGSTEALVMEASTRSIDMLRRALSLNECKNRVN